jgi:uncharacterized RDD family membrane protein YckC
MTEQYLKEFERWVAGPRTRKAQLRAELEEHLRGAEAAGDVDALSRLGTPREAAETFSSGHDSQPARLTRRISAALMDVAVTVILAFGGVAVGTWGSHMSTSYRNGSDFYASVGVTGAILVAVGMLWWVAGLTLLEWRYGQTLGKKVFGLRVVSESGIAPSFGQVILRRLTMVFSGPLQTIDWAFMFFTKKHQRAFDLVAKTVVVQDEETTTEHLEVAPAA